MHNIGSFAPILFSIMNGVERAQQKNRNNNDNKPRKGPMMDPRRMDELYLKTLAQSINLHAIHPNANPKFIDPSKAQSLADYRFIIDPVAGTRSVRSYFYTYEMHVKERMIGMRLLDVFKNEYAYFSSNYYENAIKTGAIDVDGRLATVDQILENGNVVRHRAHRHEPCTSSVPVTILHKDEEIVVVNKPASIPVHATSRYNFNTVIALLEAYHNLTVYNIHRLDRCTSGVLLFARSTAIANRYAVQLQQDLFQKYYVTRVQGRFPAGKTIVNANIDCQDPKFGHFVIVKEGGRLAETHFHLISYDEASNTSLVLCKPITGRTHQIRLHAQHCGFPIANDVKYGGKYDPPMLSWLHTTESIPSQDETNNSLIENVPDSTNSPDASAFTSTANTSQVSPLTNQWWKERVITIMKESTEEKGKRIIAESYFPGCPECDVISEYLKDSESTVSTNLITDQSEYQQLAIQARKVDEIWLHAWRYQSQTWTYEAPLPPWCGMNTETVTSEICRIVREQTNGISSSSQATHIHAHDQSEEEGAHKRLKTAE